MKACGLCTVNYCDLCTNIDELYDSQVMASIYTDSLAGRPQASESGSGSSVAGPKSLLLNIICSL